jgi:septum site-determining protein MinC
MSTKSSSIKPRPMQASFEIKSAQLPLVALILKSTDWDVVSSQVLKKFGPGGESPDFFDHDALVLDFSYIDPNIEYIDLVPLLRALRMCNLIPVAVRGGSPDWMGHALAVGLVEAPPEVHRQRASTPEPVALDSAKEIVKDASATGTMVIDKPLRSGQKVYAKNADLVVLAMVNQGAEVVADGNIHVYAPLRGKAMAGARGNTNARIFSTCLEPELISIAGVYRTSENPLADDVKGKAAQVRLSADGKEKLLIEPLNS